MIQIVRETHETPAWAERILRVAGGINRYGEPNYRACWGWNRLTYIGGKWEDRNAAGELVRECVEIREEPKYFPFDRWHVERWCPPESYGSPESWKETTKELCDGRWIEALGPYPERGEYELSFTLESSSGEFVQLTPEIVRRCARLIEASRAAKPAEKKAALDRRSGQEDKSYDNYAEGVLSDTPAFCGQPTVSVL